MNTKVKDGRFWFVTHDVSYGVMLLWCVWLLITVANSHAPLSHWSSTDLVGPAVTLIARLLLYVGGILRRDPEEQFFFYGMEYCIAGKLLSMFGAPLYVGSALLVLGMLILVTQYLTTRPIADRDRGSTPSAPGSSRNSIA